MTREEVIAFFKDMNECTYGNLEAVEMAIEALEQEPCYNPDEWCHDCKEYDHDKHCCPRYNKVIRNTYQMAFEDGVNTAYEAVEKLPPVQPKPKIGYVSVDDVMSVFDDFMCGEVDEDGMDTFLEMLKDKAESEE